MKVAFKTLRSTIRKFEKEFPDHKELVLPRDGERVAFEELKEKEHPTDNSFKVETIVYNYAMGTIYIFIA